MTAMPRSVRCPTCHEKARWEGNPHRPFCCERCKLQDLGAWATERYRIEGDSIANSTKRANGDDVDEDDAGE